MLALKSSSLMKKASDDVNLSPLRVILSPFAVILSAAKNLALFRVNSTKDPFFHHSARNAGPCRWSRALLLAGLFLLSGGVVRAQAPGSSGQTSEKDVPALLRTAQDALDRKDFAIAADALKQVVKVKPGLTAAWFNLAYACAGLHKNEEAAAAYRQTVKLDPDLFEARLNLGILLLQMKDPQGALEHLEKAAALKPDHVRAQLYYGRALALTGQAGSAEKQLLKVISLDSKQAGAYLDLGQLYLQQKRDQEALGAFEKATELNAALPQAQLGAALAMERLKDPVNAADHFEQYLAATPDDLDIRYHLAHLYVQQGKNEQAYEALQIVRLGRPETSGLAAELGDVCRLLKKFPESEKYYREALAATPADPEMHRSLGHTLLDEKKLSEAEGEFRSALKIDSRNRDAAQGLATSLYLQKRYGEAIPLLEALVRAPNPPVMLFFVLATCYDNFHILQKALDNYTRYLELSKGQNPDYEWQATQRAKLLRHQLWK